MRLAAGAHTDIGTRKNQNQDAYGLRVVENDLCESALAVVCDGVGGMSEGEIASGVVVSAFLEWFGTHMVQLLIGGLTQEEMFAQWLEIARQANDCIYQYGRGKGLHVGTTATVLLLMGRRAFVMNIGDTRLYCIDQSGLRQVTTDHTLVQREVEQGLLTSAEARVDKRKNILIRCLGAEKEAKPDFYSGVVRPGSIYLLCTDGLRNVLEPEELQHGVAPGRVERGEDLTGLLQALVELSKSRGERDNITAAAFYVPRGCQSDEQTVDLEDTVRLRYAKERVEPEAQQLWTSWMSQLERRD